MCPSQGLLDRSNVCWAESQQWGAPTIIPSRDVATFSESEEASTYKADLVRKMRMGHVSVWARNKWGRCHQAGPKR